MERARTRWIQNNKTGDQQSAFGLRLTRNWLNADG